MSELSSRLSHFGLDGTHCGMRCDCRDTGKGALDTICLSSQDARLQYGHACTGRRMFSAHSMWEIC